MSCSGAVLRRVLSSLTTIALVVVETDLDVVETDLDVVGTRVVDTGRDVVLLVRSVMRLLRVNPLEVEIVVGTVVSGEDSISLMVLRNSTIAVS